MKNALAALAAVLLAPPMLSAAAEPTAVVRTWQGIPGIERTPKGRLFVSWFSGGSQEPSPQNAVYLCRSDDQGKTFTPPLAMAGPTEAGRTFDPTLWRDPAGRLWYIFNRGNKDAARHGVYARTCADPDAPTPVWSDEFRVGYDEAPYSFRINKPTVLSTGQWIMPVTHAAETTHDWFAGAKQLQGVGISDDNGKTWKLHGAVKAPHWALENMIVQLRDGRLWMLIRTGSGFLWQSYSSDRGQTWTEGAASSIPNPGSRFFIRRLASGNLLLVNHYRFKARDHITARLSVDDGKTWNEGLLLDERKGVSYPDGVQAEDGLVWLVYDRDRQGAGEILLATFREQDVAAGRNVSGAVRLKVVVNKLDKQAAPISPAAPVVQPEEVVHPPLRAGSPQAHVEPRVVLHNDEAAGRLSISVDGAEGLVYRYGKDVGFPRFYPIWSPSGKAMTVQEAPPYPHHQSFWFADTVQLEGHRKASFYVAIYSRIDKKDPRSPFGDQIVHVAFLPEKPLAANQLETGMKLVWRIDQRVAVLDQEQRLRIVAIGGGQYFLDIHYCVTANYGNVTFVSDAVHYAWPYVRMHPQFSVNQGGRITNSEGGVNQKGTCTKDAHWVDYSNTIGGVAEGLAIFSHRENEYPHKWLTRDYGTFGPRRPDPQSGKPFTLAKGHSLNYRVGILVHSGDVTSGNVGQLYQEYCEGKL